MGIGKYKNQTALTIWTADSTDPWGKSSDKYTKNSTPTASHDGIYRPKALVGTLQYPTP